MEKVLPKRNEVDKELTWDLTALFETVEDYDKAVEDLQKKATAFSDTYQGNLNAVGTMIQGLSNLEEILILLTQTSAFASLPVATDVTHPNYLNRSRRMDQLSATIQSQLSFFDAALMDASNDQLDKVTLEAPKFKAYIRHLKIQKKARLAPEAEKVVAQLQPILNASLNTYETNKLADMAFGSFEVEDVTYPLSYQLYEDYYAFHPNADVRREAFRSFYGVLSDYQHVNASLYYTEVQKDKTIASLRGYNSVFDYLLEGQEITPELYNRQIDMIMTEMAPVMRKYAAHLKEVHGLDKLTYADLKIDLDPNFALNISIDESKKYVEAAVSILGKDYSSIVMNAYSERWVDFARNQGKQTGGFCWPVYDAHPYILMTWNDKLSDVYTLIHELGHAGQGILSDKNNSVLGNDPSMYLIEAPSTFNELLLTHYLQEQADSPRKERYVLASMISNTYFHNFITHLHEAAYQREVYRLIDEGESFGAEDLNLIKRQVLEDFWGDEIEINSGAELTWMRQPHYYMGLYSYTYSAGLTIATQAYLNVREGKVDAVKNWLKFLRLGDSLPPIPAAQVAGVDITTSEPLSDTITFLHETVNRIIALTEANNS